VQNLFDIEKVPEVVELLYTTAAFYAVIESRNNVHTSPVYCLLRVTAKKKEKKKKKKKERKEIIKLDS